MTARSTTARSRQLGFLRRRRGAYDGTLYNCTLTGNSASRRGG